MHKFEPRGIIKWSPFAALSEYQSAVEKIQKELDKDISYRNQEYFEYLDNLIKNLNADEAVLVNFYEDCCVTSEFGELRVIDSNYIKVNERKIHKQEIIDIIV